MASGLFHFAATELRVVAIDLDAGTPSKMSAMATKAQRFKAEEMMEKARRAPAKKKKKARPRRDVPVDTAAPGVSATDRKAGKKKSAARNVGKRAGQKAEVMLEDSATTPSRKSTRRSANRGRIASSLERISIQARHTPAAHASAARARATTVRGGKKTAKRS